MIRKLATKTAEWGTFTLGGLGLGVEFAGKTAYQSEGYPESVAMSAPQWMSELQSLSRLALGGMLLCAVGWLYLEWGENDV